LQLIEIGILMATISMWLNEMELEQLKFLRNFFDDPKIKISMERPTTIPESAPEDGASIGRG
jgi:hypothetical protein